MNGLWEKDVRLLLRRKQSLLLIAVIAIAVGITQEKTFILGYLPFLGMILTISTISIDEMENGYTFLMTLPINAKTYVQEKYLFCISGSLIAWVFAVIAYCIFGLLRGETVDFLSDLPMMISMISMAWLFMMVMIPAQLKFGTERSRIALLIGMGMILALAYVISNVIGFEVMKSLAAKLVGLNEFVLYAGAVILLAAALMISYFISVRIMQAKEL